KPDGLVVAARGEDFAPRPVRNRVHDARVALELADLLAVARIPEANGLVLAGGSQERAVRTERDAVDRSRVPGERPDFLAGREVPELYNVVEACRGQELAVGAEREAVDERAMPFQLGRESHDVSSKKGPGRSGLVRRREAAAHGILCDSPGEHELQ